MDDVLMVVIVIFAAGTLMIVFPLMMVSNTQDDITQVAVQSLVAEFVNNAITKGKITQEDIDSFLAKLYATGNPYSVELEHKIMTTNPNKGTINQLGENLYYSVFFTLDDSQVMEGSNNGEYLLKKGDYIILEVKNTNITIAEQIMSAVYSIIGKDTSRIVASAAALVPNTGNYSN